MNKKILTKAEILTIETYNANADHWSTKNYHQTLWGSDFTLFSHYLPHGKVIDVGCGSGTNTQAFLSAGYDYIGIDASIKLIEKARKLYGDDLFQPQNIYELDFAPNSFDGFWAAAILLHIPKARIDTALDNLYAVLKPDGVGFISVKKGIGERVAIEDSAEGIVYTRLFSFFGPEEIKHLLTQHGFSILEFHEQPYSQTVTWLRIHVRKI